MCLYMSALREYSHKIDCPEIQRAIHLIHENSPSIIDTSTIS